MAADRPRHSTEGDDNRNQNNLGYKCIDLTKQWWRNADKLSFFRRREVGGPDDSQGNQGDGKPDFSKRLIKNKERPRRVENLQKNLEDRCKGLLKEENVHALKRYERTICCSDGYIEHLIKNLQERVSNGKQTSHDALKGLERLAKQLETVEECLQPHLEDWHRRGQEASKLSGEIKQNRISLLNDLEHNPSLFTTQELKRFNDILNNISINQRKARETIYNYLSETKSIEGEYTSIEQCDNAFKALKQCNDVIKRLKVLIEKNIIDKKFDQRYARLLQWAPLSADVMRCKPNKFRWNLQFIDIERRHRGIELLSKSDMHEMEQELASFDHWCERAFTTQEVDLKQSLAGISGKLNFEFRRVRGHLYAAAGSTDPLIASIRGKLEAGLRKFDQRLRPIGEKLCSATNLDDYKQARASFERDLEILEKLRNDWLGGELPSTSNSKFSEVWSEKEPTDGNVLQGTESHPLETASNPQAALDWVTTYLDKENHDS